MHFISILVFLSFLQCLEFNQVACKIKSIARVVDCANLGLVEFQISMTPPHVRGTGYMLDLSGNMLKIVDINELLNQFNTVDLRDNPCCYTLYPVWLGCIITGTNNNSISTILLLFITNTLLIVASCFPYIVEYVGALNMYYLRVVRWATLIRRIQRQGIHHRIHPVMLRVFRHPPEAEALQRQEQNERLIPDIEALQRQAQQEPEVAVPDRQQEAEHRPRRGGLRGVLIEPVPEHPQELGRRPRRRPPQLQEPEVAVPEVAEPAHRPRRRAAICAQERMLMIF